MGDRLGVAAGVNDQVAHSGLCAGSTYWTIKRYVAGPTQNGFEAEFIGEREGGEFDHDARGACPIRLSSLPRCRQRPAWASSS